MPLHFQEELGQPDVTQRPAAAAYGLQGLAALRVFDELHLSTRDASSFGELFLGQAESFAAHLHRHSERYEKRIFFRLFIPYFCHGIHLG